VIVRLLLGLLAVLVVGATAVAALLYFSLVRDLPDLQGLEDFRPALTTTVVDRDGRPIGEFFEERRRLVRLEDLPPHVVQAFIAAEDDTFFQHSGIDYASIVRAAWSNLRAGGEIRQGASTITQQLVKSMLLSPERTWRRKVREMLLARRIEQVFSKEQILHLYLNQIYFGSGAYGVAEAARTYFGKDVGAIDVGEAALLAGLPKAPSRYSPLQNPRRAERRRQYVLERMREEGTIDGETYEAAVAAPPALRSPPEHEDYAVAAYFTEEVRRLLFERLGGEAVLRGGLRVETTLDLDLQRPAVAALRAGLHALDHRQGYRGPLRRVERSAIPEAIEQVGAENGLDPAAPLPLDTPLVAVVTRVDEQRQRARVAFGPDVSGEVLLEDVAWARPYNTESEPWKIQKIATAFRLGDVVRLRAFQPAPAGAAGAAPAAPAQPGAVASPVGDAPDPAGPRRLALDQKPGAQGALLSFELASGEVLALVGGYDYSESEFDRAVQAERQPGSSFKPFVYSTALGRGWNPSSILQDSPVVMEDGSGKLWRPQNYNRKFLGPITLRESLARSINNSTIHLARDVGVDHVIELARALGVRATLEPNLSIALGSYPVTLLELTRAYAVFARSGLAVAASFVRRVVDRDGRVVAEGLTLEPPSALAPGALPPPAAGERVMPATQAYLTVDLLKATITHPNGTGGKARALERPVAGKTGTTNSQADAWFIGFSPDVAAGVWVGFDSKDVLGKGETGGRAALPIWVDYMKAALADRPVADFEVPDGVVFARVDPRSGGLSASGQLQAFAEGQLPRASEGSAVSATEQRRMERLDF
jgi:penicillin-binding protein 1A